MKTKFFLCSIISFYILFLMLVWCFLQCLQEGIIRLWKFPAIGFLRIYMFKGSEVAKNMFLQNAWSPWCCMSNLWYFTSKDAENYSRRCKDCYLNIREEYTNKLSVTLIFCPPYPFHTVNIVKTVSPSGLKHKYCLTLIDQHSKWSEVIALRNFSAKTIYDALLDIFMRTGIPEISSDKATNFRSNNLKNWRIDKKIFPLLNVIIYCLKRCHRVI